MGVRGRKDVHADQRRHVAERREQVAVGRHVGADIRERLHAQAEKAPLGVERQLREADVVAGVLVGRDRVAALARPLDGTVELARRPQHEPVLRVLPALGPEGAAHVARDHADLVLGDLEDIGGERVPHPVGVLHVGVERVAILAGIVDAERAPRLHVLRVDATDEVAPSDHAGGGGDGGIGGRLIARLEDVRDVVGTLVPDGWSADGLRGGGDGRQRLVVDLDQRGRVLGLGQRLRDDEGDRVADVAHAVRREAVVRRRPHGAAVGTLALERHPHRAEPVARDVGAREHGEDAGSARGGGGVEGADPRVGVHRPHDDGVRLAGKVDVVVETALAPQEPDVLEPFDRLPDSKLAHRRLLVVSRGGPRPNTPADVRPARRIRACVPGAETVR